MERGFTSHKTRRAGNQFVKPYRRLKHPVEEMRSGNWRPQKQVVKPGLHSSDEARPQRAKKIAREKLQDKDSGTKGNGERGSPKTKDGGAELKMYKLLATCYADLSTKKINVEKWVPGRIEPQIWYENQRSSLEMCVRRHQHHNSCQQL